MWVFAFSPSRRIRVLLPVAAPIVYPQFGQRELAKLRVKSRNIYIHIYEDDSQR